MSFDVDQYLDLFVTEAEEQLEVLNRELLRLESGVSGDDSELINNMFRAAHSLKGASATLGLMPISHLTHKIEDLMDKIRHKEIVVRPAIIDVLFEALDRLKVLVDRREVVTVIDDETQSLIERVQENLEVSPPASAQEPDPVDINLNEYEEKLLQEAFMQGLNPRHIRVEFEADSPMKSVTAYLIVNNLSGMGEIIKTIPLVEDLQTKEDFSNLQIWLITEKFDDTLRTACEVSYISEVAITSLDVAAIEERQALTENDAPVEERAVPRKDEVPVEEPAPAGAGEKVSEGAASPGKPVVPIAHGKANETIRVDTHRLDLLMNLIGELLISQTKFVQLSKNQLESYGSNFLGLEIAEEAEMLGRITSALQDGLMKVRMVPVSTVFNRFPRVVRDLAKKSGKEIQLELIGEETELDKTVVDLIGDPLTHLIRNAVDHGVENPQDRLAAGKESEGKVTLRAAQEGNQIVIEVTDDGRGINTDKVLKKALDKGLISQTDADGMSEQEIYDLLFLPGFSTADQITDVSGRGVGMDVVKRNIVSLNGLIEVRSKLGKGSVFTIKLPLTLAIIQALLVQASGEIFAIPLVNVIESFRIRPSEIQTIQGSKVFTVRGRVIPIRSLRDHFELNGEEKQGKYRSVVLVGSGEARIGLDVDDLLGQQEIVIKSLNTPWLDTSRFSGATILGNGRVILILNTSKILG